MNFYRHNSNGNGRCGLDLQRFAPLQGNEQLIKIYSALLAGAAIVTIPTLATRAQAADLNADDKALASAGVNWTGFYIGGNVGWAHSRYSASNVTGSTSAIATIPPIVLPLGSAAADFPGTDVGNDAAEGGAQIGFNYQVGQAVLGLEADIQATDLNGRFNNNAVASLSPGLDADLQSSISMKTAWYATVRGRLGYSFGRLMPYVTGGLAISQVKTAISTSTSISTLGVGPLSASNSVTKTLTGYAVGAGLEYALGGGWSIKGEYLHLGFGNQSYDFNAPFSETVAGINFSGNTAVHADVKTDFDIARVGANYQF
jgi:outer membrane immunogenic protein